MQWILIDIHLRHSRGPYLVTRLQLHTQTASTSEVALTCSQAKVTARRWLAQRRPLRHIYQGDVTQSPGKWSQELHPATGALELRGSDRPLPPVAGTASASSSKCFLPLTAQYFPLLQDDSCPVLFHPQPSACQALGIKHRNMSWGVLLRPTCSLRRAVKFQEFALLHDFIYVPSFHLVHGNSWAFLCCALPENSKVFNSKISLSHSAHICDQ